MYKNSSQQVVLPMDATGESSKVDVCRTYCMVAAACPLYSPSATRLQGVLPTKELFKVMLANVRYSRDCTTVLPSSSLSLVQTAY